ncbi:PH domain-containing protein [Ornithinimicrobium cerasi]|uniref:Membrane protein YdbS, contains bPH2 (Pleckstrin homology) domain n=1 Tax=Ornithinimicrobium cerasi TaxID=2248773 RepID=A0A285VK37_9MICO|nr:PH domain-containing protein [Ornithinimicrobium cerasi]SOC54429.1 membrane protein YdbS, contains bPH2 (pleckstrin homology) domain [Ornithinimicrobium cerasi]
MGLRADQLTEGEEIVLRLRTHWKALVVAVLWAVLLAGALVALWWFLRGSDVYPVAMWVAGGVALLLALWLVGLPVLRWRSESYTVTTRRISHRFGILSRGGRDIPLHRINDIGLEKGLLDRVLGCGTLVVSDATEKGGMVLHDVPDVERVHVRLQELLYSRDDGSDDGEWPPNEPPRRR